MNRSSLPCTAILLLGSVVTQSAIADVYISEFVASNATGLQDETGARPDWIEIHNDGEQAVNLFDWKLSDGSLNMEPWIFSEYHLAPDEYIVVFASGNDRRDSQPFHTDFELKRSGEKLSLVPPKNTPSQKHQLVSPYPEQLTDTAYGVVDGKLLFIGVPTPGKPNRVFEPFIGILETPKISHAPSWFETPFELSVLNIQPDSQVLYTLDGSNPTYRTAIRYTQPIPISNTTTLRIAAFHESYLAPPIATYTFLHTPSIAAQSRPNNYPEFWAPEIPAHYTIATEEKDFTSALKALPLISIVADSKHLFDKDTGIYMNTEQDGTDWERPVSIEFLGDNNIQLNAALRIQGRSSRQPRTSPKHSFRLLFKHPYGPTTLNHPVFDSDNPEVEYNTLVLRATSNHSWTYPLADQRQRAQYLRDPWVKETQRAMGHIVPKSKFHHVFLNGLYWGIYAVSERPDDAFMAQHFGGKKSEYDVIKGGEVVAGNNRIWRRLFTLANQGLKDPRQYRAITQYLDLDNFIDFIILNHFIGNETWDYGNWYAARQKVDNGTFRFFCWDAETSMNRLNENRVLTHNADRPTALFHALRRNPDFQKRFTNRLHLHCTENGALTPERNILRYVSLATKIDLAIIAESARWGDYRLTRHPYRTPPFERYTRDDHWYVEQHRILTEYLPNRTHILLDQYRSIGLFD